MGEMLSLFCPVVECQPNNLEIEDIDINWELMKTRQEEADAYRLASNRTPTKWGGYCV